MDLLTPMTVPPRVCGVEIPYFLFCGGIFGIGLMAFYDWAVFVCFGVFGFLMTGRFLLGERDPHHFQILFCKQETVLYAA